MRKMTATASGAALVLLSGALLIGGSARAQTASVLQASGGQGAAQPGGAVAGAQQSAPVALT